MPAVQRAGRGQRPDVVADARANRSTAATCSTARRSGRATRSSRTGAGASRARTSTSPKSKGISALVVDMHAPGVEVRPLRQITDETEFNEVFFTDVFVPDDHLVGPRDEGWRIANSTLTHERGVNPRQLVVHSQLVDELWRLAQRSRRVRRPAPRAAARAGVRRGADCSSCTTGARSRAPPKAAIPARSAASTSSGGAR